MEHSVPRPRAAANGCASPLHDVLLQARTRKESAQEALRISELEMSLCRWQHRLQLMEKRLAECEHSEALLDSCAAQAATQVSCRLAGGSPVDVDVTRVTEAPLSHGLDAPPAYCYLDARRSHPNDGSHGSPSHDGRWASWTSPASQTHGPSLEGHTYAATFDALAHGRPDAATKASSPRGQLEAEQPLRVTRDQDAGAESSAPSGEMASAGKRKTGGMERHLPSFAVPRAVASRNVAESSPAADQPSSSAQPVPPPRTEEDAKPSRAPYAPATAPSQASSHPHSEQSFARQLMISGGSSPAAMHPPPAKAPRPWRKSLEKATPCSESSVPTPAGRDALGATKCAEQLGSSPRASPGSIRMGLASDVPTERATADVDVFSYVIGHTRCPLSAAATVPLLTSISTISSVS
ncbi:hypothetical protein AB1Y20_023523 [Prymnesium parvum]|uniref:Centrosomal protein POC5 n=1 Tax=Prymnesium parvum TaxID=97485 RepID=A0AB34JFP4_PRYPA